MNRLLLNTASCPKSSDDLHESDEALWKTLAERVGDPKLSAKLGQAAGPRSAVRRVRVNRFELDALAAEGQDLIAQVMLPTDVQPILSDSLTSLGLTAGGTSGFDGSGVRVWQTEGPPPDTTNPNIDPGRFVMEDAGPFSPQSHPTRMTSLLMNTATGSTVHWATVNNCGPRDDVLTFSSALYVSSASIIAGLSGYDVCAQEWDDFVLDTRVLSFNGAGNNGGAIFGTASARNVMTVGAADTRTNPDSVASFSARDDPTFGALKPEIVTPGVDVDLSPWSNMAGTSEATAIAAGLGAIVLDAYHSLQLHPQAAKALIMASARDVVGDESPPFDVIGPADGAGMPDFQNLDELDAWTAWLEGPNGSFGGVTYYVPLTAGRTYRIALGWLNSGQWGFDHSGQASSRWQLSVNPPGTTHPTLVQAKWNQGFQMMVYEAPISGTFAIGAARLQNYDTSTPNAIGIAIVEH